MNWQMQCLCGTAGQRTQIMSHKAAALVLCQYQSCWHLAVLPQQSSSGNPNGNSLLVMNFTTAPVPHKTSSAVSRSDFQVNQPLWAGGCVWRAFAESCAAAAAAGLTPCVPCRGVRHLPHVPLPRHHPAEGHPVILPAVRDLPLPLLRGQHQNRLPGCHRQESTAPCQS